MDRRIHVRAHTGNVGLFLKRGADWDGIAKQHPRAPIALPMHTVSSCNDEDRSVLGRWWLDYVCLWTLPSYTSMIMEVYSVT